MSVLALAQIDASDLIAPRNAWVIVDAPSEEDRVKCRLVNADGVPERNAVRAKVLSAHLAHGTPVVLVSPDGVARGEAVIVRDKAGAPLVVTTPDGIPPPPADWMAWPIQIPGALPGASGPALTASRSVFRDAEVHPSRFAMRWALAEYRGRCETEGLGGATWVDVALLPHQLAVVRAVLEAPSVRHVLADEVGLGKTIEALMIWSALSTQDRSLKTVIAAPKSLVPQWCVEVRRRTERALLSRRFEDLPPVFIGEAGKPAAALDAANSRGLVITDHAGLSEVRKRSTAVDLLIVDEAHELNEAGRQAVEEISATARHLLLLTATPREGRRQRGAARSRSTQFAWAVSLVDPKWPPHGEDPPAADRVLDASLEFISRCDAAIASGEDVPSEDLIRAAEEAGAALGVELTPRAREDTRTLAREATLMERVVRTRRQAPGAAATASRELDRVTVEFRAEELAIFGALKDLDGDNRSALRRAASSSWKALADSKLGKSQALRTRLDLVRSHKVDAKLEALLDTCGRIWSEDPERKVVIRCEYSATLDLVHRRLTEILLDGGLRRSSVEEAESWRAESEDTVGPVARLEKDQDSMLEALANPGTADESMLAHLAAFERTGDGAAIVLVATDVAAIGLNLQFAHDLVFYDLPWRPGLAEQWIGRLDRLGQRAASVRIFALTHPEMPSDPLLDGYTALGLFDRGFQGSRDVDDEVERLIRRADSDDLPWSEVVEHISRLLSQVDTAAEVGRALDLAPSDQPSDEIMRRAGDQLLDALAHSGFTITRDGRTKTEIQWPRGSGRDPVALPIARAALKRNDSSFGRGNLEKKIVNDIDWTPTLRVASRRLDGGRLLRDWTVAFLTPRHPLIVEAYNELLSDPTLAFGAFRARGSVARCAPAIYLIAQTQTFPGAGGDEMMWRCGAAGAATADDTILAQVHRTVAGGLRRSMTVRLSPRTSMCAWRIDRRFSQAQVAERLDEARALSLLDAIVSAAPARCRDLVDSIEGVLDQIERPVAVVPAEVLATARHIASAASREAKLTGCRVIAARERRLAAVGSGASSQGLRERYSREVEAARELFDYLASLPDHAEAGAREAITERVISAAVVEVRS